MKTFLIFLLLSSYTALSTAQEYNGYVIDSITQKGIPDVYVILSNKLILTTSDSTGKFSFTLNSETEDSVSFYHLAYNQVTICLQSMNTLSTFKVSLSPRNILLNQLTFFDGALNQKVLYGRPLKDKRFDNFTYCNGTKSSAIGINYTLDKVPFKLERIEVIIEDNEDNYDELRVYVCGTDSNELPDTLNSYFKKTTTLKDGRKKVKIDIQDTTILIFNKNISLVFDCGDIISPFSFCPSSILYSLDKQRLNSFLIAEEVLQDDKIVWRWKEFDLVLAPGLTPGFYSPVANIQGRTWKD